MKDDINVIAYRLDSAFKGRDIELELIVDGGIEQTSHDPGYPSHISSIVARWKDTGGAIEGPEKQDLVMHLSQLLAEGTLIPDDFFFSREDYDG